MPPPSSVAVVGESSEPHVPERVPDLRVRRHASHRVTGHRRRLPRPAGSVVRAGARRSRQGRHEPVHADVPARSRTRRGATACRSPRTTSSSPSRRSATPPTTSPREPGTTGSSQAVKVDDKTARFVFDRPYAAWKSLFPQVLPKHALEGEDFNAVWNVSIDDPNAHAPIGSGPYPPDRVPPGDADRADAEPRVVGAVAVARQAGDFAVHPEHGCAGASAPRRPAGPRSICPPADARRWHRSRELPGIAFDVEPGAPRGAPRFQHRFRLDAAAASRSWFRQAVAYALDRESSIDQRVGADLG